MSTKEKILAAFEGALDELSETVLIEMLLDAYRSRGERIAELEREINANAKEFRIDRENFIRERNEMYTNPIKWPRGRYEFIDCVPARRLVVSIEAGEIQLSEMRDGVEYRYQLARRL
jgi:predicted nucleic-acid-binding protein